MVEPYLQIHEAVAYLREQTTTRPIAALVLGTGLGDVADSLTIHRTVSYRKIPHFPESTVQGHEGNLLFGALAGRDVVVMQGRLHYYEGYTLRQVTLPIRIMRALGAEILFINSAAGGLNPLFDGGDVMVVTDHLNLMGDNPLRGLNDERLGDRFPDMTCPYDPELIRTAGAAALDLKIPLKYGVYAAVAGPSIETRAETRMLRILGADAVGMSTVPEVIVGSQIGFRTMVLAAITNVNLPDAMQPVAIDKVIASAAKVQPTLAALMEEVLCRVCQVS
jgi:purine-nucleoside phosphorylase